MIQFENTHNAFFNFVLAELYILEQHFWMSTKMFILCLNNYNPHHYNRKLMLKFTNMVYHMMLLIHQLVFLYLYFSIYF